MAFSLLRVEKNKEESECEEYGRNDVVRNHKNH